MKHADAQCMKQVKEQLPQGTSEVSSQDLRAQDHPMMYDFVRMQQG